MKNKQRLVLLICALLMAPLSRAAGRDGTVKENQAIDGNYERGGERAVSQSVPSAPLSIAGAISEAEGQNPEIKRLDATAERISWTRLEAWSGHLPHVSAQYDHFLTAKYLRENIVFGGQVVNFPAGYPLDTITVDASLTVFDGMRTVHNIRAANDLTEAARLEVSRARFKLDEEVRNRFYRALAAQRLLGVAEQNMKTLEDHLGRAKLSEKSGYGTQYDVLRIQANLEEARAEQDQANDNVALSRRALTEVMGLKDEDNRPLAGDLPVLKETDVPKNLNASVENREDFQAQSLRESAAGEAQSASRSFWVPSVSLFAQEQFYKFGDVDPTIVANSSLQNAYAAGIRLTWNIFDGGASLARQKEANAASQEASAETEVALTHLPVDFDTWKRQFFHNIVLYHARLRALDQSEESVRLALAGVKAGSRTNTEVLDAELELFRSRAGLIRAQADAIDALGKLELATGHRIWSAP